jgi:hypothetical protein
MYLTNNKIIVGFLVRIKINCPERGFVVVFSNQQNYLVFVEYRQQKQKAVAFYWFV